MKIENKVQLITYPDSLGKDLKDLDYVLNKYLKDAIGGVHILPYYPSSGDRGFAPLTHKEVSPEFGTWKDIQKVASKYILMSDLMVNHVSFKSQYVQDYLEKGSKSKYVEFFVTSEKFSRRFLPHRKQTPAWLKKIETFINNIRRWDKIFHVEGINRFAAKKLYRPRPKSPLKPFTFADGNVKHLWCSFTKDQVDLDVMNSDVKNLLVDYIKHLAQNGTKILRVDAAGYAVKKRGTSSFMIPETYDFISWLGKIAHENGVSMLLEIHGHYKHQIKLAETENVDYVYDFQIPLLALHAIYNKRSDLIKKWIAIRPNNAIVVFDTHDGLPVVDLEGLLSEKELDKLKNDILKHGGNEAFRASGSNSKNVDTYQVNCTYYSALDENDDAYIVTRAIQFFLPGVPQIYYDGLLAGVNDVAKLDRTGIGRDILRRDYDLEMIDEAFEKDVVKRLLKLMKFRNSHSAFNGAFSLLGSSDASLKMRWGNNNDFAEANIDLENLKAQINFSSEQGDQDVSF